MALDYWPPIKKLRELAFQSLATVPLYFALTEYLSLTTLLVASISLGNGPRMASYMISEYPC